MAEFIKQHLVIFFDQGKQKPQIGAVATREDESGRLILERCQAFFQFGHEAGISVQQGWPSQPGAVLVLSLDMEGQGGWKGRFIHKETRRTFTVQLGAEKGDVIAVQQTG